MKLMQKFFVSLLIGLLFVETASASHFFDVETNHPNFPAIEKLAGMQFIQGYGDGTFRPTQLVTRAELTSMIVRALQVNPEIGRYKNCFDDVQRQWYAVYVCYGKSNRWLSGYPGTKDFRPHSNVIAVEALRMIIDGLNVPQLAATEFLQRKWDVPLGYKNIGRSLQKPQWYETYLVTAREYKLLDITPPAGKMMNRAEIAELIYRALKRQGVVFTPDDEERIRNGSSPSDAVNSGTSGTGASSVSTPPVNVACQRALVRPSHEPTFHPPQYCAFDLSLSDSTQIQFGDAYLPVVWGAPYDFKMTNKSWAMALAYASQRFEINPAYLLAVAIKESRFNCDPYPDGCFQIAPVGFSEVKSQFPQYVDFAATHELVHKFETGAVMAALYFRFAETLYGRWYDWRNFYSAARDKEARELIMSRGYNRGLWDPGVKAALRTNRAMCQNSADFVTQCFPQSANTSTDPNGVALDHGKAITDYCRRIGQSAAIYDPSLSRDDVLKFIDDTLIPTHSSSANVNWTNVKREANEVFSCLENSNRTISYRYDFKTFLRELFKVLPSVQEPQNNTYASP